MYLIDTTTLKLERVIDERQKKYAILSHVWGSGEVSFRDFQDLKQASKMQGFAKIEKTCKLALSENLKYAWVDTCCIDKDSSAELSEAINSMYRWYGSAEKCYAYLEDVYLGHAGMTRDVSNIADWRAWKNFVGNDWTKLFNPSWNGRPGDSPSAQSPAEQMFEKVARLGALTVAWGIQPRVADWAPSSLFDDAEVTRAIEIASVGHTDLTLLISAFLRSPVPFTRHLRERYMAEVPDNRGLVEQEIKRIVEELLDGVRKAPIRTSAWLRRGWTLQELIAPKFIDFFDRNWERLGTRESLQGLLTGLTKIPGNILRGTGSLEYPIAQKMSWAAKRKTTRAEDEAYCLLGLFDVNMPMLYGEGGKKAFLQLQHEIIRQTDDHSIFAWSMGKLSISGSLADAPIAFAGCDSVCPLPGSGAAFSMTNRGLSIKLLIKPFRNGLYLATLNCGLGASSRTPMQIYLLKLDEDDQFARIQYEGESFHRSENSREDPNSSTPASKVVKVKIKQMSPSSDHILPLNGFRLNRFGLFLTPQSKRDSDLFSFEGGQGATWGPATNVVTPVLGRFGNISFARKSSQMGYPQVLLLKIGFDFDSNPVCIVVTATNGYDHLDSRTIEELNTWSPYDEKIPWNLQLDQHPHSLPQYNNVWALRGNRRSGLKVMLTDINLVIDIYRIFSEDASIWCLTAKYMVLNRKLRATYG